MVKITIEQDGEEYETEVEDRSFVNLIMQGAMKLKKLDQFGDKDKIEDEISRIVTDLHLAHIVFQEYTLYENDGDPYWRKKVPWAGKNYKINDGEVKINNNPDEDVDIPEGIKDNWIQFAEYNYNPAEELLEDE